MGDNIPIENEFGRFINKVLVAIIIIGYVLAMIGGTNNKPIFVKMNVWISIIMNLGLVGLLLWLAVYSYHSPDFPYTTLIFPIVMLILNYCVSKRFLNNEVDEKQNPI